MIRPRVLMAFVSFILLLACSGCQQAVAEGATNEDVAPATATVSKDTNTANIDHPTPPIAPRLAAPELRQKKVVVSIPPPDESTKTSGEKAVAPQKEEPAVGPAVNWVNTENYLILGTDRLPGQVNWRTDSIMLVGIDREKGRAAVLSVPRDLWVQIPDYGWGRINQVDYLGEQKEAGNGPAFVSQVLSQTLGVSTKHWVRIQMDGFQGMVNAIGGVTIHLDCPFYELPYNSNEYFTLPAGDVHLDGATAYRYVRLRLRESDIGRASRQRQVLWALRTQALNSNLITQFPQLWSSFQGMFSTDLGLLDMLDLARLGMSLDKAQVRAGGITLNDLQSFRTSQGADVLRIANPNRVRAVVDGVWEAPEMDNSRQQNAAACPALPPGVKITQQVTQTVAAGKP